MDKKDTCDSEDCDKQTVIKKDIDEVTDLSKTDHPPKSMLEILYQYVPYVFSSSPKESEENTKVLKQQEVIKLKVFFFTFLLDTYTYH